MVPAVRCCHYTLPFTWFSGFTSTTCARAGGTDSWSIWDWSLGGWGVCQFLSLPGSWEEFVADLWRGWALCLLEAIPLHLAYCALYGIFSTLCSKARHAVNFVHASRVCYVCIGWHSLHSCHSCRCPPLICFALLFVHCMCIHHSSCALFPPHSSLAPILGLLPTIMLQCSSQDASLHVSSCFLPVSCYFATAMLFYCCHTVSLLSYYSSIVMLLCH